VSQPSENVTPISKPAPSYVRITPDTAARMLAGNQVNRILRRAMVNKYARDMIAGRWVLSNDAICFSSDGKLLNGQHRLTAVVESGQSVVMLVIRNMSPESMTSMDSGAARTAGDALHLEGISHANVLAATARLCILWADGRMYKDNKVHGTSHGEIRDFVIENPSIRHSVAIASRLGREVDAPNSAIAAAHWIISTKNDMELVDIFIEMLSTRSNLGDDSPLLAIDSRLRKARRLRTRHSQRDFIYLLVKGWNYWATGRAVRSISMPPPAAPGKAGEHRIPTTVRWSRP